MREALAQLDGERFTFRGVFIRFGVRKYRDCRPQTTVLIREVEGFKGHKLTDHVWMGGAKEFLRMELKEGDRAQFDARVKRYRKRDRDAEYDGDGPRWTEDWKLSNPTKVRKIEAAEQIEDLPLFKGITVKA